MKIKNALFLSSLACLAISPAAFGADPTGNIQLTVPSQIQYSVSTTGNLISPSPSLLRMDNDSGFEVRVASIKMNVAEGVNVVDNAYDSSLPNAVTITLGPLEDPMKLSSCINNPKDVSNVVAWTMASKDDDVNAASIQLASEGYAANIRDVGTIGNVEWYVVSDTMTNQVLSRLDTIEGKLEEMACPFPIGSIFQITDNTDPNTLYPGTEWIKIEGKFLLGSSSTHALGSTGGEETHTLTVSELASHNHAYDKANGTSGSTTLTSAQSGVPAHSHGMNNHTHSYTAPGSTSGATTLTESQIPKISGTVYLRAIGWDSGSKSSIIANPTGKFSIAESNYSDYAGIYPQSNRKLDGLTFSFGGGGSHTHSQTTTSGTTGKATGSTANNTAANASQGHTHTVGTTSTSTGSRGDGAAHNNMPPYETVNIWKRTA